MQGGIRSDHSCSRVQASFRIESQDIGRFAQCPWQAKLSLQAFGLGTQPRHLLDAEIVRFRRRHGGRTMEAHEIRVPEISTRQIRPACSGARHGQVFVSQVIVQPAIRRQHVVAQLLVVRLEQAAAVRNRRPCGEVQQRSPERGFAWIFEPAHGLELRQHANDDVLRQHEFLAHACAQVVDGLVHPGDEAVHAAQERVVVACRAKRMCAPARPEQDELFREAPVRIDREQLARVAEAADVQLALQLEGLVRDHLVPAQLVAVDLRQSLERFLLDAE
jgi:hypothetical protein